MNREGKDRAMKASLGKFLESIRNSIYAGLATVFFEDKVFTLTEVEEALRTQGTIEDLTPTIKPSARELETLSKFLFEVSIFSIFSIRKKSGKLSYFASKGESESVPSFYGYLQYAKANRLPSKRVQNLILNGQQVLDFHNHPHLSSKSDSLPSPADLDNYYRSKATLKLIGSQSSLTVISFQENSKDFLRKFNTDSKDRPYGKAYLSWIQINHPELSLVSSGDIEPSIYETFLKDAGVIYQIIPWGDTDRINKILDNAQVSKDSLGGIDFNADKMKLDTENSGQGIQFHIDPAQLKQLQNASGFSPVIISIQPMTDIHAFLGV